MARIAFVHYEASTLRIYVETSTVSIISEQPSYTSVQIFAIRIPLLKLYRSVCGN